jgi:hypothetical protein
MTSAGEHDLEERLARLESVTDTGLAHLDVDDLLLELLNRVRSILEADTAAVLLLDESADELIARAAAASRPRCGRVRIPLGVGVRVASRRRRLRSASTASTKPPSPTRSLGAGHQVMLGVLLGDLAASACCTSGGERIPSPTTTSSSSGGRGSLPARRSAGCSRSSKRGAAARTQPAAASLPK